MLKSLTKKMIGIVVLISVMLSFVGCSFFDVSLVSPSEFSNEEALQESNNAFSFVSRDDSISEKMAREYIHEKYEFSAEALGHIIQRSNPSSPSSPILSTVTIPMRYGDSTFCVYLDTKDSSLRYDNYQKEVVSSVLEDYLLSACELPEASFSVLYYDTGSGNSFSRHEIRIEEPDSPDNKVCQYDTSCMLDFRYNGQKPEQLLKKIKTINYTAAFSGSKQVLSPFTLPYDVTKTNKINIRMSLWNYEDLATCESNVIDEANLTQNFQCSNLNPSKVDDNIRHGADEVRFCELFFRELNEHAAPKITNLYAQQ